MRTTPWDKIITSTPVNKQAAKDAAGHASLPTSKVILSREWDAPPKLRAPTRHDLARGGDLRGREFGRLTVIGIWAASPDGHRLWVCRCACGKYVARKAKAITNPRNTEDRCETCRQAAFLRREDSAEQRARRKAQGLGY